MLFSSCSCERPFLGQAETRSFFTGRKSILWDAYLRPIGCLLISLPGSAREHPAREAPASRPSSREQVERGNELKAVASSIPVFLLGSRVRSNTASMNPFPAPQRDTNCACQDSLRGINRITFLSRPLTHGGTEDTAAEVAPPLHDLCASVFFLRHAPSLDKRLPKLGFFLILYRFLRGFLGPLKINLQSRYRRTPTNSLLR